MVHDIITHYACSVSWAEIWEFSKSQRDIIHAIIISKIIVFDIICYVAYYSATQFKLPIYQPSNMATRWNAASGLETESKTKLCLP